MQIFNFLVLSVIITSHSVLIPHIRQILLFHLMYVTLNLELMLKSAKFSYTWGVEASPTRNLWNILEEVPPLHWDMIPENDGSI